ncbi:MAG: acyl-CoA thioesterase [Candidatus Eisenbacteria bacterium]|nr:acyl-CoA thioesterase [Candidatus Eisenbacteria bacterium]
MKNFPIQAEIDIRFRDTDAIGHVNNAVYVTYLEVGRQAYWRAMAPEIDYRRVPFVMARLEIDWKSPAWVGEILIVAVRMSWAGAKSFGTEYEIREQQSQRLVVTARSVQATFDHHGQCTIPIPADFRAALERVEGHPLAAKPAPDQEWP